jgi:potassium-dependent mechanosensitive channel
MRLLRLEKVRPKPKDEVEMLLKRNIHFLTQTTLVGGLLAACSLSAAATDPAASVPVGTNVPGAMAAAAPKEETLSVEQLQAGMAALAGNKDLTDDVRKQVTDLYQAALKALTQAQADDKQAVEYQDALDNGKARAQAIRQEKLPPTTDFASQAGSLSVKELEPRLVAQVASVRALSGSLEELDRQIKALKEEPATRAAALAAARAGLDQVKLAATSAVASPSPEVAAAERALRQARQRAATAHVRVLELMQASAVARQDLLAARREQLTRRVAAAKEGARQLNLLLTTRQREVAEAAQRAAENAGHEPPAVREVIEQNARLGKQLAGLTGQSEQIVAQLREVYSRLQEISQNYEIAKEELALGGVGVEQAEALRRDRRKLPGAEQGRREVASLRRQINETRAAQLLNNQESQALEDPDRLCAQILAEKVLPTVPQEQREAIRARVRGLLGERQQLVENLGAGYAHHLDVLNALLQRQQQLADKSAAFAQMLDERLLWIPTATPFSQAWLGKIAASAAWLTAAANWRAVGGSLAAGAMQEPARALSAAAMVVLLLLARGWLRARLVSLGELARATDGGGFKVTGLALVATLLLVVPGPLLLWTVCSFLSQRGDAPEFVKDVSRGMYRAAAYWFYLELLRQLCRRHGLADAHFKWNASTSETLRRNLAWLAVVYPLLTFVIATTYASALYSSSSADHAGGLGRCAFVAMSVAVSLFLWSVLRRKDLLTVIPPDQRARWLWRTRLLWYPFAVIAPLVLGAAAMLGYFDAALIVEGRLLRSFLVIIAVLLLHNLVTRWLLLLQNKILLWEARERQALQALAGAAPDALPPHESPQVDLAAINAQTRSLFDTLLWVVMGVFLWTLWADMLPALRVFGNVALWQHAVGNGPAAQLENITVANLFMATLFGALTVMAVRNVPGLLEILLLPRLSLDAGLRYAINRVAIYLVITAGAVATFNAIGIGWSEVQWLAAAFSVGLGFGLQEIFANFISGLIMLFERPVRVGDIVTVEGMSGTVSRIRMRATTITDGDNKEIIVPNKKFITDQVTNWTLSDPITRVVIQVALTAGADAKLAEQLMLETARAHRLVLPKPAPSVFFTQFGESALNFELRVFVKQPADRMPVINDLHLALTDAFRKNGLQIP